MENREDTKLRMKSEGEMSWEECRRERGWYGEERNVGGREQGKKARRERKMIRR